MTISDHCACAASRLIKISEWLRQLMVQYWCSCCTGMTSVFAEDTSAPISNSLFFSNIIFLQLLKIPLFNSAKHRKSERNTKQVPEINSDKDMVMLRWSGVERLWVLCEFFHWFHWFSSLWDWMERRCECERMLCVLCAGIDSSVPCDLNSSITDCIISKYPK